MQKNKIKRKKKNVLHFIFTPASQSGGGVDCGMMGESGIFAVGTGRTRQHDSDIEF